MQVLIILRQIAVGPDDIFRAVQVVVFQILFFHFDGRNMVSVHDQNHRFLILRQGIGQFFDKLIHLIDLVYIIFPLPLQFLRRCLKHLYGRILKNLLCRVLAVSLHGNRIDHIMAFRGFECIGNAFCQHPVLRPVFRRLYHVVHIFNTGKRIEADIGKYRISVIEHRTVIVNRVGAVAQTLQIEGQAFGRLVLQNRFVWIFSRSKELH